MCIFPSFMTQRLPGKHAAKSTASTHPCCLISHTIRKTTEQVGRGTRTELVADQMAGR